MPFDYVAADERNVALPELRRHTVFRVYRIQLEIRHIDFLDLEAIAL